MKDRHLLIAITAALSIAVVASAIGVVYSKHEARKAFVELQELIAERDALEIDWGRLRLEQSAWAAHGRIERMAHDNIAMEIPEAEDIVIVTR
ncbi:MAG: cell division protein FtsL [Gammaproteobacteria bacterium]